MCVHDAVHSRSLVPIVPIHLGIRRSRCNAHKYVIAAALVEGDKDGVTSKSLLWLIQPNLSSPSNIYYAACFSACHLHPAALFLLVQLALSSPGNIYGGTNRLDICRYKQTLASGE